MGYFTWYSLNVSNAEGGKLPKGKADAIEKAIDELRVFQDGNIESGYSAYDKWYESEEDMCVLSQKFPDVLFTLYGDGEDSTDSWVSYYLDGAYQHETAKIEYAPFDRLKLCSYGSPAAIPGTS